MAQRDVYRNPVRGFAQTHPYLVDIQSNLWDVLSTTIVVPLVREAYSNRELHRLNPAVIVAGERLMLSTHELFSIPRAALGTPLARLAEDRAMIVFAIDRLVTGFG